jgi:hypothetical protein
MSAEEAARAHGIDPEAAAAVLGSTPAAPAGPAESLSASEGDEEGEENIYEVMKQHMRRKQEELEARNAQIRQQRAAGGRPGPGGMRTGPQEPPRPVEVPRARDLADLEGVWNSARQYLAANARILETVLGGCTRVAALTTSPAEVTLEISKTQERFTNDRAKAKLEEALRAVTGLNLRLHVHFVDTPQAVRGGEGVPGMPAAPAATVQRVPPEIIEAVKKQAVVQELMKRFDATVTQVELLGTGEA